MTDLDLISGLQIIGSSESEENHSLLSGDCL